MGPVSHSNTTHCFQWEYINGNIIQYVLLNLLILLISVTKNYRYASYFHCSFLFLGDNKFNRF